MTIETKELVISEELKKKIDMICKFACVKYELINGCIINLKNTNIAYTKPPILKVNGNDMNLVSFLSKNRGSYQNNQIFKELLGKIKDAFKEDEFV